ncbi:S8 family peptidase [Marinigracilibium pacificum]|uniref:S8 family serine peptidase n=1 Tax=Marinigracilibium pacificum TaxID=2729599 RepID=A0A848IZD2_9BACT|nr:S8 family peptidase [Marinigracilibium pacificum]NMM48508.1 S8 family serine peptidase [Marinigracilibium pacificum]
MQTPNTTMRYVRLFKKISANLIFAVLILSLAVSIHAQNKGTKDLIVRSCKEEIGNGKIKVNFSYDNPNKKGFSVPEEKSQVKFEKINQTKNGPTNFKYGLVKKAYSQIVNEKESVRWEIENPNGKIHVVYASSNSSHCPEDEVSIIVPAYQDGKSGGVTTTELNALFEGNAGDNPTGLVYQLDQNKNRVLIEIIYNEGQLQNTLDLLQNTFGLTYSTDPLVSDFIINPQIIISENLSVIDVWFQITSLGILNNYNTEINLARPAYPGLLNNGLTTSQGDTSQNSNIVRESFRTLVNGELAFIDGTNVKLGVISNGLDTQLQTAGKSRAQVDVENGDLPGTGNPNGYNTDIDVIFDYPYGPTSDEGRAMLQSVHDIAPGAELAFASGVISQNSFKVNFKALAASGANIICDDIAFVNAPLFGTTNLGVIMQEFSATPGNAVFSSIGNFGNDGYQGNFTNSSTVPDLDFINPQSNTRAHVFGTNPDGSEDITMSFSVEPGTYMITVHWNELYSSENNSTGAATDIDLLIVDDQNNILVNINRFSEGEESSEIATFEALGSGIANIMILSSDGPAPEGLPIRLVAYVANGLDFQEYAGAPTVGGHQMTPEVATIGASFYGNNTPTPQPYSSFAGTLSNGQVTEADFLAPDGGNVNVLDFGIDIDSDGYPNFFGTSNAAPHAAAAYALLLQATNSWFPDGLPASNALTESSSEPNQLLSLIKNTTSAASGVPEQAGSGFLNIENTFRSIAAQTANITQLIVEEGKTPSAEPFTVTILGKYLPDEPIVNFNGLQLEITETGDGYIKAIVPPFTGNPGLNIETTSITPSGFDGGPSNELKFFDDNKTAINIIAVNDTITFGQKAAFEYIIEGLLPGQSLETEGLPAVIFSTPAVFPYPDANNYLLTPSFETPLTPEQEELFQVNFISGVFVVNKLDMTVIPNDTSFTYGEAIVMSHKLEYDETDIENPNQFLDFLTSQYNSTFYDQNTLIVINEFKPIVNNYNILELLTNGSWISTKGTIENEFKPIVNNMNIVELNEANFLNYFDELNSGTTNEFKAIVNEFKAIVNAFDLFNNNVLFGIENEFKPIVNNSGIGDGEEIDNYSKTYSIISESDIIEGEDQINLFQFYSIDLITGYTATKDGTPAHYSFPGSFLGNASVNLNLEYGFGKLFIDPAELSVLIQDFYINDGEEININEIISEITGYVYNESAEIVFPNGVTYRFIDDDGNEYESGKPGIYNITLEDPNNYFSTYLSDAKLFVNVVDEFAKKIRTYLDCVEYDPTAPDGLNYIANFRYLNPNDYTIFIGLGEDNLLTGSAERDGNPPTSFYPGEGTFQIRFDGNDLKWSLTSNESTHKSSTSLSASSSSNKCSSGNRDSFYIIYPNPVHGSLTIEKNVDDESIVEVYDYYGNMHFEGIIPRGKSKSIEIDFSSFYIDTYLIKIQSNEGVKIYSVIKE